MSWLDTIAVTRQFPHPPVRVWQALTDRDSVARWFMPTDDFRAELGHTFRFQMPPQRGWDGQTFCTMVEVVPHTRLAYRYRGNATGEKPLHCAGLDSDALDRTLQGVKFQLDTVLRFTLTPHDGGTRLQLEHGPYRGRMLAVRVIMAMGWRMRVLKRLEVELAGLARTIHENIVAKPPSPSGIADAPADAQASALAVRESSIEEERREDAGIGGCSR